MIAQDEGWQSEAEAFARKAVAAAPGNPLYLNTLGNGLLAQGRSAEAVDVLAQAHALEFAVGRTHQEGHVVVGDQNTGALAARQRNDGDLGRTGLACLEEFPVAVAAVS